VVDTSVNIIFNGAIIDNGVPVFVEVSVDVTVNGGLSDNVVLVKFATGAFTTEQEH
jgi:hypothetical protein